MGHDPEQSKTPPRSLEAWSDEELILLHKQINRELGSRAMIGDVIQPDAPNLDYSQERPEESSHLGVVTADMLGVKRFVPGTQAWWRRKVLTDFPALGFRKVEELDRHGYYGFKALNAFYAGRADELTKKYNKEVKFYPYSEEHSR